ncbi:hypothetical protein PRVXT_001226 [Proteinivorax tanatarense]|uniref:Uncharacterized protein n=1 Tax=Proteinivorax tanatarense TaxID=1260629 RepID=A0AAU7VPR1_9FIRM
MSKIIDNVVILDVTDISEKAVEEIEGIGNVVMMFYSQETKEIASQLNITNLVRSYMVPKGAEIKTVNDTFEITENYLREVTTEPYIVVNGTVIIKGDVSAEQLKSKISGLIVNGTLLTPNRLEGAAKEKLIDLNGETIEYDETARIIKRDGRIDNALLMSLDDGSNVCFIEPVKLLDNIDLKIVEEKLGKVEFAEKVIIKEEFFNVLKDKISNLDTARIEIVPSDHLFIDENLNIDELNIKRFNKAKVMVKGNVTFRGDVSSEQVQEHIDSLVVDGIIACPNKIVECIFDICQDPQTEIITYEGEMITNNSKLNISESMLKYKTESVAIINFGKIEVDDDVSEELLNEKIEKFYNYGKILADEKHLGIIHGKAKTNAGLIIDKKDVKLNEKQQKQGTNAVYLKL